ncbi:Paf1-domain-containing protein [Aaosphaeria arxii CBS 175.79]|uniref:Paf1-domain-containing protein n=1 Tax=Aaosphaeria arxii CBS 175.79 TaxID=1450172 RepID=A0A6A5XT58_9PLEO|nr:Paf1-domain-containing protein [Aaosphaeria arxii CBS 175.79]KAF2016099.1 Paf1-domain-containing protein [Aaosphaeria arxii CBS 175.79]
MSSARTSYQQDYIARIRYSNALPPPPCPPKLLDIPNTGLSSGQYTSAGFASRLAREQPLNIEADAELGMPVDLVGIPGVFDGDEAAIQALDRPPLLHPADRALMRPPTALGKPMAGPSGISFLRKTEYTTSYHTGGAKFESSNSSNTMRVKAKRRRPADVSQDDPTNISRQILKGFNIAYPADAYNGPDTGDKLRAADILSEERQAWKTPKHPLNPSLQLLDSYPLLPDWDAVPDTGSYQVIKFTAPPVRNARDQNYDERLDVALLRPMGQSIEDNETYLKEVEEHKEDPTLPTPLPRYHFEFFLPSSSDKVRGIKRNFSTNDPDNEDEINFDTGVDDDGRPRKIFKYERIRNYETANQTGDPEHEFSDVVAVALHDPESHEDEALRTSKLQKAAYFYPIKQKIGIRPKRQENVEFLGGETQKVDVVETIARNPEVEVEKRENWRKQYDIIET